MFYLLPSAFIVSLSLTWFIRRYAVANNIIDIPNERSSHVLPTPRGGGIAFIIVFLLTIPLVGYYGYEVLPVGIALVAAGLLVALVGFLDDHGHIRPRLRLLGHFSASILAIYIIGGMPSVLFFGSVLSSKIVLNTLAIFYLVWMLNLYNFMDGIDGIAAIEALSVCLGGTLLYWLHGHTELMGLPLALAATVAGFLWWNFPPARIFMGDAGSGFLGLILGILSIQAAGFEPVLFWCWLILLGTFIVDATVTLIYRLLRGCKVYEAHRSHAYQHATQYFGRHLWVTLATLLINLFWLLPIAVFVINSSFDGFTGLIIAYIPLIFLAIWLRAGRI